MTYGVLRHQFHQSRNQYVREQRTACDQFMLAALETPKLFRTRLQNLIYDGPHMRKEDVDEHERSRWIQSLPDTLPNTDMPTGKVMVNSLGYDKHYRAQGAQGRKEGTFLTTHHRCQFGARCLAVPIVFFPPTRTVDWEVLAVSLHCSVSPACVRSSPRCSAPHLTSSATGVPLRRPWNNEGIITLFGGACKPCENVLSDRPRSVQFLGAGKRCLNVAFWSESGEEIRVLADSRVGSAVP